MATSRRWLLGVVVAGLIGVSATWFAKPWWSRPRWNVLVVTFDTTRADRIGCYGYADALTPSLDRLAGQGILFERAYAPAPLTLPSHATLFTGLQPPEHGLLTNGRGKLAPEITTLAEILSEKGYSTAAFVASFVLDSRFGLDQGFDNYDDDLRGTSRTRDVLHRERSGRVVVDAALKWLTAEQQKPFHCWIHLYDPHLPYLPHQESFGDRFFDRPYDAEIAFADLQLGRIVEFLRQNNLSENTLIVVAGDHGEGLHEHLEQTHGYLLYGSTLHVPLVIVAPGSQHRGRRIPDAISLLDVFPTVLDLLNLPVPAKVSGQSLAAACQGQDLNPRLCFSVTDEPMLDNGWAPLRSLTTSEWKYIRTLKPELYDLRTDSRETTNLAADHPELVTELEQQLTAVEENMTVREAAAATLSSSEKRALASLGYTGGLATRSASGSPPDIDVKDMLPLVNQLAAALDLLEGGRAAEAESVLREVVQAAPDYTKALGNLGISLAQQGKWDEAAEMYRRVLRRDPQDSSALLNLGAAFAALGQREEALKHYQAALAADRDSPVPAVQLGLLHQEAGQLQRASQYFAEAVRRDPECDEAHRCQGDLAAALGNLGEAVARYEDAIVANPNSVPALVNLGIVLARRGEFSSANARLLEALTLAPQDAVIRQNLGLVYLQDRQPARAADEFELILQQQPDHVPTLLSLGWLRAAHPEGRLRRGDQAVELAEQACQITRRESADALDLLAAAYAENGRFREALLAVGEALKLLNPELQPELIRDLEHRRELFRLGKPYRSPIP